MLVDLSEDDGDNTLQWLVKVPGDEDNDVKRLKVLKELRKAGLLVKKDIQEHQLLRYSCWMKNKKRFVFLVKRDPDALIETRFENKPLIHYIASQYNEERICVLLMAGFECYHKIGGLLFIKDDEGTTAFDCLCNKKGVEKVMSMLHDILSPDCDYPILHHVFINAPQHKDVFMKKFPWAFHLKDHNGRTLQQAVLAAGPQVMNANDILLATLSDNQIQTKDPVTTLYPFAAMAIGEHADLEQCYYLLRRQPSVMDKRSRASKTHRRSKRTRSRKKRKSSK